MLFRRKSFKLKVIDPDSAFDMVLTFVCFDSSSLNFSLLSPDVVVCLQALLTFAVQRLTGGSPAGIRLILW